MITRSRIFILVGVILGLGGTMTLSGCTRGTNLDVVNRSTTELTNVVATGSGFTKLIGSIPVGEQRSVSLNVGGESALKLDFDTKGKHFKSEPQGYFEGGSNAKVTATISPKLTVTVETKRSTHSASP
jgi:hypothetical protein